MIDKAEIDRAVSAHRMWKTRLQTVISTGTTDTPVAMIAKDDQCAFGQWLYGPTFSAAEKGSSHYETVKRLHGDFHVAAARVATMATSGRGDEAQAELERGGDYATISQQLTLAMMEWKKTLS